MGGDCGGFTAVGGLCPVRPEGVDATGHGGGVGQDAIAALVLLALTTRLPMRNRGSQDEPGCVPGIT